MPTSEPTVQVTETVVSLFPPGTDGWLSFQLQVVYKGGNKYAVQRGRYTCLDAQGHPSDTADSEEDPVDWFETHRFPYEQALAIAKNHVHEIKINGFTAADHLAREGSSW